MNAREKARERECQSEVDWNVTVYILILLITMAFKLLIIFAHVS